MSRRAATLIVASALIFVLGLAGALLPVPYVALRPGPTYDTLGRLDSKGQSPVIQISGRQTYPTDGHLNFVTVAYQGGPGNRLDLFTALRGWLDPHVAVVPEETIFPRHESTKKVEQQNTQEMTNSQEAATAAALHELNIAVPTVVTVESVQKGMPADGRLQPGDVVLEVDHQKIAGITQVTGSINRHKPGDKVIVTVQRGAAKHTIEVGTVVSPDRTAGKAGRPVIGVILREQFRFPFNVKVNAGDVGGPSAGLMFSLGIYDKLTPDTITGGRFIAGTGTVNPQGQVGPIGGIQQKLVAARGAGASVFLTPSQNCADAAASAPKGLRLVRVDTMHGALQALTAIRTGQGNVPTCVKGP